MAALALVLGGVPASAATTSLLTDNGTDPSAAARRSPGSCRAAETGLIARGGGTPQALPGTDPAIGPDSDRLARGRDARRRRPGDAGERLRIAAPGAEEPALSGALARLARPRGRSATCCACSTSRRPTSRRPTSAASPRPTASAGRRSTATASCSTSRRRSESRIEEIYLPTRRRTTLRTGRDGAQLLNPSEEGGDAALRQRVRERQQVLIGPRRARRGDRDRALLAMHATVRRDAGHEPGRKRHREGYPGRRAPRLPARAPAGAAVTLWSTALAPDAAYVSRMRRTARARASVDRAARALTRTSGARTLGAGAVAAAAPARTAR